MTLCRVVDEFVPGECLANTFCNLFCSGHDQKDGRYSAAEVLSGSACAGSGMESARRNPRCIFSTLRLASSRRPETCLTTSDGWRSRSESSCCVPTGSRYEDSGCWSDGCDGTQSSKACTYTRTFRYGRCSPSGATVICRPAVLRPSGCPFPRGPDRCS